MGLADRDYMRERAESQGAVYVEKPLPLTKRNLIVPLAVCVLIVVAILALTSGGDAPLMGPMRISIDAQPSLRRTMPATTPIGTSASAPRSGWVEWGPEGQPIGGSLERLEIWDVTQSKQAKLVHIRSGPDTTFAIVYLAPGRRTTLMVPTGRSYQVTAMSGRTWQGPIERFGPDATTVNFGIVDIQPGSPGLVAMGASDQEASIVPNDRF